VDRSDADFPHIRVTMDQVDAVGHWAGNTQHEIYADKIPKNVCRHLLAASQNVIDT
jgi:hypothetical protein